MASVQKNALKTEGEEINACMVLLDYSLQYLNNN